MLIYYIQCNYNHIIDSKWGIFVPQNMKKIKNKKTN